MKPSMTFEKEKTRIRALLLSFMEEAFQSLIKLSEEWENKSAFPADMEPAAPLLYVLLKGERMGHLSFSLTLKASPLETYIVKRDPE